MSDDSTRKGSPRQRANDTRSKTREGRRAFEARCRARREALGRKMAEGNASVSNDDLEHYDQLSALVDSFDKDRKRRVETLVVLGIATLLPLLLLSRTRTSHVEVRAKVTSFAATAQSFGELDLSAPQKWGALNINRPTNLVLNAACAAPAYAQSLTFERPGADKGRPFALEPLGVRTGDRFSLVLRNHSMAIDLERSGKNAPLLTLNGRAEDKLNVYTDPAAAASVENGDRRPCFDGESLQATFEDKVALTLLQLEPSQNSKLIEVPLRISDPSFYTLRVGDRNVGHYQTWGIQEAFVTR